MKKSVVPWSGASAAGVLVSSLFISMWLPSTAVSSIRAKREAAHRLAQERGQSVPPTCIKPPATHQTSPLRSSPGFAEVQIQRLISDSAQDREAAKRNLLNMGEKSIEPLMAALWELITDRRPRFSPGKEKKGEEAVKRYMALAAHGDAQYPSKADKAWDQFARIEVNHMLGQSIIDLLVKLKAEQVVCPLVALLWGPETRDTAHLLEISALEELGSVGVPRLIAQLRATPGAIAQARTDLGFDPTSYSPGRAGDEQPQWRHLPVLAADESHANVVQWHIVLILEQIGDPRAVPALRELASTASNGVLARTATVAAGVLEKAAPSHSFR